MNKSDLNNTQKQPLVSIVVATYNGERFLREQLDSIIGQSYSNLEIIIQDDGSSDETCTIINSYAAKDPRIRFFQNEENLGIIQNFYDLLSKTSGKYIAISDQDDIWELNKIELLLNLISNNSLVYTDSILIDNLGNQTGETLLQVLGHKPKMGKALLSLFSENTVSGHACMFSKSIVPVILSKRYETLGNNTMYDQLIAVIASLDGGVKYSETPLTYHRIHSNNHHNSNISKQVFSKSSSNNRPRLSFFKRKQRRVLLKIKNAKSKVAFIEHLLNSLLHLEKYSFGELNAQKKFQYCFFNRTLYRQLVHAGFNKIDAKKIARGRLHYIFFRFF